ncbi:MAG: DUF805 domain-containing protein [Clostridium sp.]|nr:DUF805 domain-containing protein [Clostridium sp.]
MGQYCKYCGNKLEDGAQFCGCCGNKVENSYNNTSSDQYNYSENGNNYNGNINNNINMNQNENPFIMYYADVFKNKYAMFNGRASRKEYWMFVLFNCLISIGLCIPDTIIGADGILVILYSLATIIPSISILVRRLHDIGKSGAWYFISLVPFIGGIWLLILLCTQSQYGQNQYGNGNIS